MKDFTTNASVRHASRGGICLGAHLSIYLDALRFGAALVVFLAHASYVRLTGGVLPEFGLLADDAVMAFFVLSGFVIAFTAENKDRNLDDYARARLARLYSVAAPALLLTIITDQIGILIAPAMYQEPWYQDSFPVLRLVSALMLTHEIWFASIRPFSNGPYWSIGYEFWYYALFGCWFYLSGMKRWLACGATALLIGPKILLLFPVWALGVVVYRIKDHVGPTAGLSLFFGSLIAYALFKYIDGRRYAWHINALLPSDLDLRWSVDFAAKYVVGFLVACNVLGFAAMRQPSLAPIARPIRWLAGMTFSLYLFHYPLLHFFSAILPEEVPAVWRAIAIMGGALVAVAALAPFTEHKKAFARQIIDKLRLSPAPA